MRVRSSSHFARSPPPCCSFRECPTQNSKPETEDIRYLKPKIFDLQGHRGARGARPENTWPAFRYALDARATTLEMDAAVTADAQIVLSHEPWMNPQLCRLPSGEAIPPDAAKEQHALFDMDYARIARYDCGSRRHPDFPDQQPVATPKPLLADVLREADALAAKMGRVLPFYNIETKTRPAWDGRFHPAPEDCTRLLMETIADAGVTERAVLQSFDERTLRAARRRGFGGRLALLVSRKQPGALAAHVERLGFAPDLYSPDYRLVEEAMIEAAAAREIDVVPWTVNDPAEMRRLKALGVQGLITDYPQRGRFLLEKDSNDGA